MDNQSCETDLLIVGSGGGGMTAALVAHDAGLKTLIVEKTPYCGGATARSGGGIWVPNSSASVMGTTYPVPGAKFGPAMTFGYIAARHAAGINTQPD